LNLISPALGTAQPLQTQASGPSSAALP
jgi:hypothetical protein